MQEILATFDGLAPDIPLGPVMFYRYDVWPQIRQEICYRQLMCFWSMRGLLNGTH
jgi:hypothetical protein